MSWNLNKSLLVAGAIATLLAMLAFNAWDVGATLGTIMMFAPAFPGVVFAAVLLGYDRPWVYLTTGLLLAVMPIMVVFVFGALPYAADPLAGGEQQAVVLLLAGLAFSLHGGIAGFVQGRKGAHTQLRGATSKPAGLVPGLVAALVAGILVTSGLAASQARSFAATGGFDVVPDATVKVTMKDFEFHPKEITIPAGRLVEVVIVNEDAAYHTLTYKVGGKLFEEPVVGGATSRILVRHAEPQTIKMWCAPHSGGAEDDGTGMIGTIKVV